VSVRRLGKVTFLGFPGFLSELGPWQPWVGADGSGQSIFPAQPLPQPGHGPLQRSLQLGMRVREGRIWLHEWRELHPPPSSWEAWTSEAGLAHNT
jgi:hypothetical protein